MSDAASAETKPDTSTAPKFYLGALERFLSDSYLGEFKAASCAAIDWFKAHR